MCLTDSLILLYLTIAVGSLGITGLLLFGFIKLLERQDRQAERLDNQNREQSVSVPHL